MVPLGCQNFIIKGGVGYEDKGGDFERKRTISEVLVKRKEKTKGKVNIASRYPIKATITHTWIQRESNFASFEG